jgi:hypothetical protein
MSASSFIVDHLHSARRRLVALSMFIALAFAITSLGHASVASAEPIANNGEAAGCPLSDGSTAPVGTVMVWFHGATYDYVYCGSDGNWHLTNYVRRAPTAPVSVPTAPTDPQAASLG